MPGAGKRMADPDTATYEFDWDEFLAHKRRGGSLKDFENKRLLPLSAAVIRKHLIGSLVVGIYPVLLTNESVFLAADFDGENWKAEARTLIGECSQLGMTAYLERSRSGNGGHVWMFFAEPYSCQKSRRIGRELIRRTLHISEFEKEISFDRLFPNQDAVPKNGNAAAAKSKKGATAAVAIPQPVAAPTPKRSKAETPTAKPPSTSTATGTMTFSSWTC